MSAWVKADFPRGLGNVTPRFDESLYHGNVYLGSDFAVQHGGQHYNAMLGKRIWQIPATASV